MNIPNHFCEQTKIHNQAKLILADDEFGFTPISPSLYFECLLPLSNVDRLTHCLFLRQPQNFYYLPNEIVHIFITFNIVSRLNVAKFCRSPPSLPSPHCRSVNSVRTQKFSTNFDYSRILFMLYFAVWSQCLFVRCWCCFRNCLTLLVRILRSIWIVYCCLWFLFINVSCAVAMAISNFTFNSSHSDSRIQLLFSTTAKTHRFDVVNSTSRMEEAYKQQQQPRRH